MLSVLSRLNELSISYKKAAYNYSGFFLSSEKNCLLTVTDISVDSHTVSLRTRTKIRPIIVVTNIRTPTIVYEALIYI